MTDWEQQAECRNPIYDPELWWANDDHKGREATERAKAICNTICTVRDQCLIYALENGEDDGLWGGTTPRERKRLTPKGA